MMTDKPLIERLEYFAEFHTSKRRYRDEEPFSDYDELMLMVTEVKQLKEQLKYALSDSSVEGEPRHYPFCDTCGRICHEITLPNTFIEEYTCHYCCERRDSESQVKQLTEENIGLRELNNGLDYCAEQSDIKRKDAEAEVKRLEGILDSCHVIWRPADVARFNEIDSHPVTDEERQEARRCLNLYLMMKPKTDAESRLAKALTKLCWCYGKHCHEWTKCHADCAAWSIQPIEALEEP